MSAQRITPQIEQRILDSILTATDEEVLANSTQEELDAAEEMGKRIKSLIHDFKYSRCTSTGSLSKNTIALNPTPDGQ